MYQKPSRLTCDWIILDYLYPQGSFIVYSNQRNGEDDEVVTTLYEFVFEAALGDGELEDGVLHVAVAVAVGKGFLEGEQVVFLCDHLDEREQAFLAGFQGDAEVLEEILSFVERISSGFDFSIDGVGLIVIFKVYIKVVDGGQIANEVIYPKLILLYFLVFVVEQLIFDYLVY